MTVRLETEKHPVVGVLGLGRFGSALRNALEAIGVAVKARDRDDQDRESLADWMSGCKVLCLAIRDDQLPDLVKAMAEEKVAGKTVLIHGGTAPLKLLSPLQARGATVGKFHPLQSFTQTGRAAGIPKGTPFAIEGEILDLVKPWVSAWSGELHVLGSEDWLVYHLAAVTAANFLPLLIRSGASILEPLSGNRQSALAWLRPLVQKSVDLALDGDVALPFSGPAIRRDQKTMELHRHYLRTHFPDLLALYRLASERIMDWPGSRNGKANDKQRADGPAQGPG